MKRRYERVFELKPEAYCPYNHGSKKFKAVRAGFARRGAFYEKQRWQCVKCGKVTLHPVYAK